MPRKTLVRLLNAPPEYAATFGASKDHELINASVGDYKEKLGERFQEPYYGQDKSFHANRQKTEGGKLVMVHSTNHTETLSADTLMMDLLGEVSAYKNPKNKVVPAELTAVLPFFTGDREDRGYENRVVSMKAALYPKLLKAAGVDRVVRITPHSKDAIGYYEKEFGENLITLSTAELFAEQIRKQFGDDLSKVCIGAPDGADKQGDEGQRRAFDLARAVFGDLPEDELRKHMFFIPKEHVKTNETKINEKNKSLDVGNAQGRHCIIIDDMIDSGGTIKNAATFLKDHGATSITTFATHALFPGNALGEMLSAKWHDEPLIDKLNVADTVTTIHDKIAKLHPEKSTRISVLSTAPMVMKALEQMPPLKSTGVYR